MFKEELSDDELRDKINAKEEEVLYAVYNRCKDYCINYMRKISVGSEVRNDDLEEIYNDAILVFEKKYRDPEFKLHSSIKTYITGICKLQLLNKYRVLDKLRKVIDEEKEIIKSQKNSDIDDPLVLEEDKSEEKRKLECFDRCLLELKRSRGNCYELITLHNLQSMSIPFLTERLNYKNDSTTKNQVYKCKKQLKKLVLNCINNL